MGIGSVNLSFRLCFFIFAIALLPTQVASADVSTGIDAYQRGNFQAALVEFKRAAKKNNHLAQYNLGLMHFYGHGVKTNVKEAVRWLDLSATQGNADAQLLLGVILGYGLGGVGSDERAAIRLLYPLAEKGVPQAQFYVAVSYKSGKGLRQDYDEAIKWLRLSADQHFTAALELLADLYRTGDLFPKDNVVAYAIYNILATDQHSSLAIAHRDKLLAELRPDEIRGGQRLSRDLSQRGSFLKVLDAYRHQASKK